MNKQDLALNNPQGLICHKTDPTTICDIFLLFCVLMSMCIYEQGIEKRFMLHSENEIKKSQYF